jgi:hypothetical protein
VISQQIRDTCPPTDARRAAAQAEHPENHFVFDHTKWIFYAATCYTWLGDDQPAEEHARELIAYHARPDGSSDAPMRTSMSHIDLGIIRARHGDLGRSRPPWPDRVQLRQEDRGLAAVPRRPRPAPQRPLPR